MKDKYMQEDYKDITIKNDEKFDLVNIEEKITALTEAVPELNHAKKIFGRTNSQYTAQLMTLTMLGDGPYHYMKQCAAQLDAKKSVLQSVYYKMKRNKIKLKKLENETDEESLLKIERIRLGMIESQTAIEHTMREITMYQQAYNEIAETYGIDDGWDEADFLKLEEENHIRMAFRLAIRRLMEQGSIDRATSEYFEANGIHPMSGERLARKYHQEVTEILDSGKAPAVDHFYNFLDRMVELFRGSHKKTMKRIGIKDIIKEKATLLTHDHPDLELYLEHHGYKNTENKLLESNKQNLLEE